MQKDFDGWNRFKKILNKEKKVVFAYPGEIWWCTLGLNIGAEIDGKNNNFERAVLILHVYNKETLLILPITSKRKEDMFHYCISAVVDNSKKLEYLKLSKSVWVKLTQSRVISYRRLLRKGYTISGEDLRKIKDAFKNSI